MTDCNSKVMIETTQTKRLAKRKTLDQFITESKAVHGDKYDYSQTEYKNVEAKVTIICPIHGEFSQKARRHTGGMGCAKCSPKAKLTKEMFVERSRSIHGDRYDYVEAVYLRSDVSVKIKCHKHGYFEQRPTAHMSGSGCPKCFNSSLGKHSYQKHCSEKHDGSANLYIIRCFNKKESFYKVGITAKSIQGRFPTKKIMPYDYEVVKFVNTRASNAWDLEKAIRKILKGYKYLPEISFQGVGECYKEISQNINQIENLLTRLNA